MFMVLRAVYEQDPKCGIPVGLIAILTYKGLSARPKMLRMLPTSFFT
jgi:hypothetical protein